MCSQETERGAELFPRVLGTAPHIQASNIWAVCLERNDDSVSIPLYLGIKGGGGEGVSISFKDKFVLQEKEDKDRGTK